MIIHLKFAQIEDYIRLHDCNYYVIDYDYRLPSVLKDSLITLNLSFLLSGNF